MACNDGGADWSNVRLYNGGHGRNEKFGLSSDRVHRNARGKCGGVTALCVRACLYVDRLVGKCTVPMSNLLRSAGAKIDVSLVDANQRPLGVSIIGPVSK